jgi:hypothetical protein
MTADEPNPTPRRRKEAAPRVIEGSAKVIAEEPVAHPETEAMPESAVNSASAPSDAARSADPGTSAPGEEAAQPKADTPTVVDAATAALLAAQMQDEAAKIDAAGSTPDAGGGHSTSHDPALQAEVLKRASQREQGQSRPDRGTGVRAVKLRRRWWLYAIVGTSIAAGLMALAYFGPFGSSGPTPPGIDPRPAPIDSKVASSEQSIATLDKRLAAVEAAIQQLASGQNDLKETVASDARKLADTNTSLSATAGAAKSAMAAAQAALDNAAEARASSSRIAGVEAVKPVDLKPLQDRMARIEAALAQPKVEGKSTADPVISPDSNTVSLDHAAALAVVAQTLIQAIDRGEPFPRQVAAMESLGAEANQVAILKPLADSGVATAQSLRQKFAELGKGMSPVETEAPKNGDFFGKIWQQITHLVRVRPIGASGESGALVARIEAALARSDATAALAEWQKLPPPAKDVSQNWANELKSRAEAIAAASTILTSAIGDLGKPKS